jgi:acetyltransferase-like isoleucine patch superfamily enzyme
MRSDPYISGLACVGHPPEHRDWNPETVVCGHAELGQRVRCGVNASILPFRKVGDGARIGAGAVVTKDVPAGEVWAGNPARKLAPVAEVSHAA